MSSSLTIPTIEQLKSVRLLVVGDAMLDRYWYGTVERISPEAPVPVVRVQREEDRLGAASNVAVNVISLGAQATLLTVVGDDEPSHTLERLAQKAGIHAEFTRDSSLKTTVKLRIIGRQQQLLRADFENAPQTEVLAALQRRFEELVPSHDAVLLSDYGKGGLTHVARMIAAARAAGKPVLVDPKGSDYSGYAGATVITPNTAELRQAVGAWGNEEELHRKAHALRKQLNLQAVLMTRSEEGMSLFDEAADAQGTAQASMFHVPAQAREVYDVTGAGDTVIATLATLMGAGLPMRQAIVHANRAGGVVVGKFGTATVSYQELFGTP